MPSRDPTRPEMPTQPDPALLSLLAFWADAGVEYIYEEAPVNRLAPQPPPLQHAPEASPAPVAAAPTRPAAAIRDPALEVERARSLAAAALDLAALQQAVRAFDTPLRPRNAPVVFARGAVSPALVVIGQGPGAEDEAAGQPFAGRSGAMLDRMLAAAGLNERALIFNTAFWRAGGRISPAEVEAVCAPLLARAISLAAPRALLLVGEGAVRAVTGRSEPIHKLGGRWLEWTGRDAVEQGETAARLPALPIFHPDFLMKQPAAKKRAWADLLTLADRIGRS